MQAYGNFCPTGKGIKNRIAYKYKIYLKKLMRKQKSLMG